MSDRDSGATHMPTVDRPSLQTRLVALAALTVLAVHFSFTALYVAPVNPVNLQLQGAVHRYMTPLFQQNWQLFAPTPVNEERGLLVRARVLDPATGVIIETDFHDFTSPLVNEIHRNRLFAGRRSRMITNGLQVLGFRDPIADRIRLRFDTIQRADLEAGADELQADADGPPLLLTDGEEETYVGALEVLERVAFDAAEARWGPDVEAVQLRLAVHRYPRFSERHRRHEVGDLAVQDFAWFVRDVEADR